MNTGNQFSSKNKAIEEARSAGYSRLSEYYDVHFLDPAFWQALGRARRWSEAEYSVSFGSTHPTLATRFGGRAYTLNTWRYHWHRFIDHLAEGKSAEDFFAAL